MLKLWINTFGREFYTQHAALFLFIFYLVFGAAPPVQMLIALTSEIGSSSLVISIFFLFILLYAIKCLHFVRQKISTTPYNFVYLSSSVKKKTQFQNWLWLYSILLLPALIYTSLIIFTGIFYKYYWAMAAIVIYTALVLTAMATYTYQSINYTFKQPAKQYTLIPEINIKRPYWTWSIYYLLETQTFMLVACKALSFALFKGITWTFADVDHNVRAYLIGILATILVHGILIATVVRFERSQLSFTKSLPIKNWSRLFHTYLFLIILFIPEIVLYIVKVGFYAGDIISGVLFCLGGSLTLRMALYLTGDQMGHYLKIIFIFFLISILAILTYNHLFFSLIILTMNTIYYLYLCDRNKL